ncbi:MAG: HAMP domain-containing protein [Alphaproteobacteria bacterium]|nr:HAMP domain-containing protein [Alphaproteobacteria bacterium]
MGSFVWSSDLLVGHERIDLDHRQLVDLSSEVEDLIATGGDIETLRHKLSELYTRLAAHCSFEEELMRTLPHEPFGARVNDHIARHAVMLDTARELLEKANRHLAGQPSQMEPDSKQVIALMKTLIQEDRELVGILAGRKRQANAGLLAAGKMARPVTVGMYLTFILVSVLLLLLAMLGLTYYETTERVEGETRNAARAVLGSIANDVAGTLNDNRDAMERIANRPLIRTPTQEKCDGILWEFREIFPRFANATTIELDGTALCSAVPQPGGKPVNVGKAEWFQRAQAEKTFVVGKPFLGPITGRWVSVLILPVYDDQGVHLRYLGFPLDLAALVPRLGDMPLHEDSVAGIATQDGTIVWRSKDADNWVGKSLKDRTAFSNFVEMGIGETTTSGVDDVERTYFFERIEASGWVAWIGVPTDTPRTILLKVLPPVALLGLFGLSLVSVISFLLTRRIVGPMRELAETARAIQNGKLDARARLDGPREVVEVAREINAMIDLRERQTDELMRSNVELERFAYVASHDLQEPVRTVVAYSQLLERKNADRLDDDGKEYLGFIVGGAKRMGELVRDLLSYSRISGAGRKFAAVDLAALATDAVESLREMTEQSGASVEVDSACLPTVLGDAMQLTELLQNLVINAIRFCKPGIPPRIRITATANESHATICVSDNGIGIERQYWDHIFLVFKRLHGASYPGTGIGLAICKRIVEGHGGRIWVASKPGEGSSFFFTLPLA